MIDTARLLSDLKKLVPVLEDDMRFRFTDEPSMDRSFRERYDKAVAGGRTGATYETWREGEITQAAVAWLLGCVFVRFLEDNDLIGERWIRDARDRYQDLLHRGAHRDDREYLELAFTDVARLPGVSGLFDRAHNPLFALAPTGGVARRLLDFFRDPAPDGTFHDFSDTAESTRFLGDLYQDISESARKRYALLQTPDFVVEFILDRTLEPALAEFGLKDFRLVDPTCGSGHFLLAAFERVFRRWTVAEPNTDVSVLAQRALHSVCGVDLNPFAVAIARFRLLIAAVKACGTRRLSQAHDWKFSLVTADSLLFGAQAMLDPAMLATEVEEPGEIRRLVQEQRYHVVVGNPPYINVQDPTLRTQYRNLYESCSGKYQISVPFTELFFAAGTSGSYIGMITSNAFMQKQFGKRLVEEFLPRMDLTHVIDTKGVYLAGFGTPTVILLGRRQSPINSTVRVVRGIRGETIAPEVPGEAPVWVQIRDHTDEPGFEGLYISVADAQRMTLQSHPWSITGGGATELKERLDCLSAKYLRDETSSLGFSGITAADDVMVSDLATFNRVRISPTFRRPFAVGDCIRDWSLLNPTEVLFPYTDVILDTQACKGFHKRLWPYRTVLGNRATFTQKTYFEEGKPWWGWHQIAINRTRGWTLPFAFVSTHFHTLVHVGSTLFKQTAPIIKLPEGSTNESFYSLAGLLNSSTCCFWLKQVCRNKGTGGIGGGLATETWEQFYEYDSTNVSKLPLPSDGPFTLAAALQIAADERNLHLPANLIKSASLTRAAFDAERDRASSLLRRMMALQEELDWQVYHIYGLTEEPLTLPIDQVPEIDLGQRAFEIVMARDPELETTWFERHGSKPHTEIPAHWPEAYRNVVQRRIDRIGSDSDIALIEQPEYKRRWNLPRWEDLEHEAVRSWLLDRLESESIWSREEPELLSVERLADRLRPDAQFRAVAALYASRDDYDLATLIRELALDEAIPFLPVLRYKESGVRKREQWERTWDLQRHEDEGEAVGEIPVPPKYSKEDFVNGPSWRLRGKLDVPKERFILYPGLERDTDRTPVVAWAGFDHAEQARALAGYYNAMRADEGWNGERLKPILAGLRDLLPWLRQWHGTSDESGFNIAETIDEFLRGELAEWSVTEHDLQQWRPAQQQTAARARTPQRSARSSKTDATEATTA